jgi:hypothetical protein
MCLICSQMCSVCSGSDSDAGGGLARPDFDPTKKLGLSELSNV